MRKTLVGALVLVALVWVAVVTVGVIGWRLSHDIPELDVSDLVVEYSDLSPDENAYTYFAEVTNTLYWPSNSLIVTDYLEGEAVDSSEVEEIVANFQGSFSEEEIPLGLPIPVDTGYCRCSILRDFLYVCGKTAVGKQKRVKCGPFSEELLKNILVTLDSLEASGR